MNSLRKIPQAPGGWPLLGHSVAMARDPLGFFGALPAVDDLVAVRFGPRVLVVACTPELTSRVLADDRTFDKGGPVFDGVNELFGLTNIIGATRTEHRRLRRLVQPAFQPARLAGYASAMIRQIGTVVGRWKEGQTIDVVAEMQSLTMRAAVDTILTGALDEQALQDTCEDLTAATDGVFRRVILPKALNRLPTRSTVRYNQARTRLRRTVRTLVATRRSDAVDHGDVLSALLSAKDPASTHPLTDTEITDQAVAFFAAASETCAGAISWALHFLSQNPDVERRLHAEVDAALAGASATHDHLPALGFTARVINETLRMYPSGWAVTRTTTSDTELGGHVLPEGTSVVVSPYLIHRRPDLYPDPDRFDPDRPTPPRNAFLPFGGGARKCVGDQFGLMEATLALATITARLRLTPAPGSSVRPAVAMTLYPRGLYMRVGGRERAGAPAG